jgi:hypothetical protein
MANENSKCARDERAITTWDEDERDQRAVFRQVLEHHPDAFTHDELIRELTGGGSKDFGETDAIQRAVKELAAAGLLHRPGEDGIVRPTRAALRYFQLTDGGL